MSNKSLVENIIRLKQQDEAPYMASTVNATTDMDTFPYPRFFRGDYNSSNAIIFEREAGFKPRRDDCYQLVSGVKTERYYPNHCFQAAPSVQYPCYPEYLRKDADKDEMKYQLFRTHVNQYR